jgi:hypothetical protein
MLVYPLKGLCRRNVGFHSLPPLSYTHMHRHMQKCTGMCICTLLLWIHREPGHHLSQLEYFALHHCAEFTEFTGILPKVSWSWLSLLMVLHQYLRSRMFSSENPIWPVTTMASLGLPKGLKGWSLQRQAQVGTEEARPLSLH